MTVHTREEVELESALYNLEVDNKGKRRDFMSELGFWQDKTGRLHKISEMKLSHLVAIDVHMKKRGQYTPMAILLEIEFRKQGQENDQ